MVRSKHGLVKVIVRIAVSSRDSLSRNFPTKRTSRLEQLNAVHTVYRIIPWTSTGSLKTNLEVFEIQAFKDKENSRAVLYCNLDLDFCFLKRICLNQIFCIDWSKRYIAIRVRQAQLDIYIKLKALYMIVQMSAANYTANIMFQFAQFNIIVCRFWLHCSATLYSWISYFTLVNMQNCRQD